MIHLNHLEDFMDDHDHDPMFSQNPFFNHSNFALALDGHHLGLNILNIDDPLLSSNSSIASSSSSASSSTPSSLSPGSDKNSILDLSNSFDPIILTQHHFMSASPTTLKRLYSDSLSNCSGSVIDQLLNSDDADSLVSDIDCIL